jgi:iron complex outermembrane receptor protein
MLKFRFLLGGAFIAAAAPAYAQSAPTTAANDAEAQALRFAEASTITASPATGPDAPADGPAAGEDRGLNAIVVTAMRRETNLQRTPISISVMNAENLADRHVQSMMDLADGSIPGLRIATFEARNRR